MDRQGGASVAEPNRLVGVAEHAPLNKAGVVAAVAEQAGLTSAKASQAVDAVFGTIEFALRRGREVRLTGFGSFAVTRRKPTTGRNPRTGVPIEIGPSVSVRFKPGRGLKDAAGAEGG
ncbi:MAG: HU family DNA-binding protein [Acetobacteraceae bacterium]